MGGDQIGHARIGVHTGEARLCDEGNYIGPTINRTARLRDLAHGGQTVLSGVTKELVFDQLPVGAWLTDLGTHRLRDVARPERVAQLCHPDLRNEFPPLRMAKTVVPHRLPAPFTSFVGRGTQMEEVRKLLAEHRLVTLAGAGGAGKARFAIEIAGQMADEFGEGVWYADLAPISQPDPVTVTVARALGLPDQPGASTADTLVRFKGDLLGARTTADEAVDCSSEHVEYFDVHCSGVVAIACLAAGDAAAAWEATAAARQLTQPMTTGVVQVWAAEAALKCGDLTEAHRWADEAVSVKCGVYLSAALATRARVEVARGALEHAERDAREAFGLAATVGGDVLLPDILESLA